jgi:hypothetical protein
LLTKDEQISEDIKNDNIFKKDRRGKSYDPEFTKFLFDKFYGNTKKKLGKRKINKSEIKNVSVFS